MKTKRRIKLGPQAQSGTPAQTSSSNSLPVSGLLSDHFFKGFDALRDGAEEGRYYTRIDIVEPESGLVQLECIDATKFDADASRLEQQPGEVAGIKHSVIETSSSALRPWFTHWLPSYPYFMGYRPNAVLGNTLFRRYWSTQEREWRDAIISARERRNWDVPSNIWDVQLQDVHNALDRASGVGAGDSSWVELLIISRATSPGYLPALQYFGLFAPPVPRAIVSIRPINARVRATLNSYVSVLDRCAADPHAPDPQAVLSAALTGKTVERVSVYDVGQGNWNALIDDAGAVLTHFDCGGGVKANKRTFPTKLIDNTCWQRRPPVILSHWDFDHWSSAWRFEEFLDLTWIVPNQPLGAVQAKLASYLYRMNKLAVWPGGLMPPTYGQVRIEQCLGGSINDRGLALFISPPSGQGPEILLPGDARYDHIPGVHPGATFAAMVASHHGANIRTIGGAIANSPSPSMPGSSCAISFGAGNGFGHPATAMKDRYLAAGWRLLETAVRPGGSPGTIGLHWLPPGSRVPSTCTVSPCTSTKCTLDVFQC